MGSSVGQEAPDGRAADIELLGNRRFAKAFLDEPANLRCFVGDGCRSSVWFSFLAGLSNTRFHAITQNVALELGEHRQHAGERPPARRRQIDGLAQSIFAPHR